MTRRLTLIEKLLFNITCIGFCAGEKAEDRAACQRFCSPHKALDFQDHNRLPPKGNE